MKIKERVYPYPVIKETDAEIKDFNDSTFSFDIALVDNILKIKLDPSNVPDKLLPQEENVFSYGVQIESLMNKNRKFYSSKDKYFQIELNAADYIGKVDINAYIYASKSTHIILPTGVNGVDPFYGDSPIYYKKGSIVALCRPTKQIMVNLDGQGLENPVRVVKDSDLKYGIRYEVDNSQIKVHLSDDSHEAYLKYGQSNQQKKYVYNAVIVPAITKALQFLVEEEIQTEDSTASWADEFIEILESRQIGLEDLRNGTTSFEEATQALLGNPIDEMFAELNKIGDEW